MESDEENFFELCGLAADDIPAVCVRPANLSDLRISGDVQAPATSALAVAAFQLCEWDDPEEHAAAVKRAAEGVATQGGLLPVLPDHVAPQQDLRPWGTAAAPLPTALAPA